MKADLLNCRAVLFMSPLIVVDPDFIQKINGLFSGRFGLVPNVYQELQLPVLLPNIPNGVQLNITPSQVMEMKKVDSSFVIKIAPNRIDIVQNRTQNDLIDSSFSGFVEKIKPICELLFDNLGIEATRLALVSASIINADPHMSFSKLANVMEGDTMPIEWEIRQVQRKNMVFDTNCTLNLSIKHNMSLSVLVSGADNSKPSPKIIQELDFNTIPERMYNYKKEQVSAFLEEVATLMMSHSNKFLQQLQ